MKAVKGIKPGQAGVVTDAPIPKLPSPEWILIKTVAVALNPTDWKHVESMSESTKATVGCDFAGVVEEVGSAVTKSFKKGDRVAGFVHGSNSFRPDIGSFAEYVAAKEGLVMHIPDSMSFEEAAGLGVGTVTVGQGLYQEMGLPWPGQGPKDKKSILIYAGSTGMGAFGIQFAKLSGFEVITTCSPKNFDYVKSLGADHVFDAYDPDVGKKIRALTGDKLYYAWDCIGENGSHEKCGEALASSAPPGQEIRYGAILQTPKPRDDIICTVSVGYTAVGEAWETGWYPPEKRIQVSAQPDHYEWMKNWVVVAERLLKEGKWRPHRQEVRKGGFEGILEGMKDMKEGKVSGVKLVYRVAEP